MQGVGHGWDGKEDVEQKELQNHNGVDDDTSLAL